MVELFELPVEKSKIRLKKINDIFIYSGKLAIKHNFKKIIFRFFQMCEIFRYDLHRLSQICFSIVGAVCTVANVAIICG